MALSLIGGGDRRRAGPRGFAATRRSAVSRTAAVLVDLFVFIVLHPNVMRWSLGGEA